MRRLSRVLALVFCLGLTLVTLSVAQEGGDGVDARTAPGGGGGYLCHIKCSNGNSATVNAQTLQQCLDVCAVLCGKPCQVTK